jgi:hypothetical protein
MFILILHFNLLALDRWLDCAICMFMFICMLMHYSLTIRDSILHRQKKGFKLKNSILVTKYKNILAVLNKKNNLIQKIIEQKFFKR